MGLSPCLAAHAPWKWPSHKPSSPAVSSCIPPTLQTRKPGSGGHASAQGHCQQRVAQGSGAGRWLWPCSLRGMQHILRAAFPGSQGMAQRPGGCPWGGAPQWASTTVGRVSGSLQRRVWLAALAVCFLLTNENSPRTLYHLDIPSCLASRGQTKQESVR